MGDELYQSSASLGTGWSYYTTAIDWWDITHCEWECKSPRGMSLRSVRNQELCSINDQSVASGLLAADERAGYWLNEDPPLETIIWIRSGMAEQYQTLWLISFTIRFIYHSLYRVHAKSQSSFYIFLRRATPRTPLSTSGAFLFQASLKEQVTNSNWLLFGWLANRADQEVLIHDILGNQ